MDAPWVISKFRQNARTQHGACSLMIGMRVALPGGTGAHVNKATKDHLVAEKDKRAANGSPLVNDVTIKRSS